MERYASVVANVVPQVIAACEKADQAIDAAVDEAKKALDVDSRALEEAVSASTDRATATAAIESLLQTALRILLDEVFREGGTLPKLLDEAKKDLVDAAGDASGDAGALLQDGAELGLPHVLKLLRSTVEKHADPCGGGGGALAGLGHSFGLSIFLLSLSRCAPWKVVNP